ncbi:hypothetical protein WOLCODRAFT_128961 [Wolfiporia cocos MD-104 SS10]|uniref:Uncharacterized protein n=1 Tax=Wolfiporia cocos (strain MD-104) TaxID=742152 RepID=A0A2H3JQU2_WOLCO|nr:hypothetical protein WOLCODRAFT_128961 [Wolfiporia cocos MD-104 SS10]
MANGFKKIRYGHGVTPVHRTRKRDACSSGGFYKSPSSGEVVMAEKSMEISWDTACMNTTAVDIYLFAPDSPNPRIHEWESVDFAIGSYNTTLVPTWWNSTSSVRLQLMIVESGTPTFLATLPAGPVFNATNSESNNDAAKTQSAAGSVTVVDNVPSSSHSLSKGKIAAAVLMTLLAMIAIAVYVSIRKSRAKIKDEGKRFSIHVDKRMSTISTEWKSVTTAGASAAIRSSIMVSDGELGAGNRSSSFSFGAIRPSSSAFEGGGQAGIGVKALATDEKRSLDLTAPHMAQIRPNVRTSFSAADRASRVSRVSFAPDIRPSSEYRRTRAFHTGYVPPLPETHMREAGEMSPTQAAGPTSLTAEDIQARMAQQDINGNASDADDDYFSGNIPVPLPSPPAPAYQGTHFVVDTIPMPPVSESAMSPDAMLRAYAERSIRSPPPTLPAPAPSYNGGGMRALYTPASAVAQSLPMPTPTSPESLYLGTPMPQPYPSEAAQDAYRYSYAPADLQEGQHDTEHNEHGTAH